MPLARFGDKVIFFVHIPKTGGASVDRYLSKHGRIALWTPGAVAWTHCSPQHMHRALYDQAIPPSFYDLGFAILRDPVARMISEYRYRAERRGLDLGFDAWVARILRRFEDNPYVLDNHIRPQAEFVREDLKLFRFEAGLGPVFDLIDQEAGLSPSKRPWANRSKTAPVAPSSETQELIRAFYAEDYALLATLS